MKYKKIILITKNPGKLKGAKKVFDAFGIELIMLEKDYIEIQASTSLEIARYTAIEVSKELGMPVIREDHSLYINSLGIPGPYTSFIEKNISAAKLLEILKSEDDRTGFFEIATVYAEPSGDVKEFVSKVPIHFKKEEIVSDPKGWSGIMCLDGEERAFSEYPEEERLEVWSQNYEKIAKLLVGENF